MANTTMEAWACEVCGNVWAKKGDQLPKQCPNKECRSIKWNTTGAQPMPKDAAVMLAEELEEARTEIERLTLELKAWESAAEDLPKPAAPVVQANYARPAHDPKTCRLYGCFLCTSKAKA